MPGFYFDFHDGETAIDEEGANFASIDVARQEAVFAVGDAVRDFSRQGLGKLVVRIRDKQGALFEVSAVIEAKPIAD
ncbi:MAG TPA: hypothetical protein VFR21_26230 [Bradyrhizobium sp.]|jgi:hypothetical protein|nr:hypothetical protein [Bradyrhizobium sp.]